MGVPGFVLSTIFKDNANVGKIIDRTFNLADKFMDIFSNV
jgi:hypothetical protein